MRRNKNKKRSTALGLLLIVILLTSGTFAFTQLRQAALNPGRVAMFAGGRIHDIYERRDLGPGRDRAGEWNKNVFAENFGGTELGVRVRFSEFLTLSGEPIVEDMILSDTSTWVRYLASGEDVLDRVGDSALIGEAGIEWLLGQSAGETKIFMPTHNHVSRYLGSALAFRDPAFFGVGAPFEFNIFNDPFIYQFSETSGRAIDALAGGFVGGANALLPDFDDVLDILDWQSDLVGLTGYTPGVNFRGQTGYYGHYGTRDFWDPDEVRIAPRFFIDEEANPPRISVELDFPMRARETMTPINSVEVEGDDDFEFNGIMTIEQWIDLEMPPGEFWIMDTTDDNGWFYWNGVIPAGQATSLLLNSITLPTHSNLEHVIHIESDFFVVEEIGRNPELDDMTDDAITIFMPEYYWIYHESFTRLLAEGEGVLPGRDLAHVYTFIPELGHYRGGTNIGYVDANFEVQVLGGGPSTADIHTVCYDSDMCIYYIRLTVGDSEDREFLTIRVTDPHPLVINHVDLRIYTSHEEQIIIDLPDEPGDVWVDTNGIRWIVLVTENDEFGGIGNALLTTYHVHGFTSNMGQSQRQWSNTSPFVAFEDSRVRAQGLQRWWNIYSSMSLRSAARGFQYMHDSNGIESNLWNDVTNQPITGVTNPVAGTLFDERALTLPDGEVGFGVPFILSISEVNHHFANAGTDLTAMSFHRYGNPATPQAMDPWWTRSPGTQTPGTVRFVTLQGEMGSVAADSSAPGFRPAIWVTPIITPANSVVPGE